MTGRRKFRPLNIPTSTPTFDQIGRKFKRRGFQTLNGGGSLVSDAYAKYERIGWVADYALTDTGEESYAWTYTAGASGWTVSISETRSWAAGETALMNGIRWESTEPSAEGQAFAGGKPNNTFYHPHAIQNVTAGNAVCTTCVSPHMHEQRITSVQCPITPTGTSAALDLRLRYYRILHNGTPATAVLQACDVDDWTNRWAFTGAVVGIFGHLYAGKWDLPSPSSYRFRRGVNIGLDCWVEVRSAASGSRTLSLGAANTYNGLIDPATKWHHGNFGVTTGVNAGFKPASQTYSLTMNGGTWRPYQTSPSDDFTWLTASGHTITSAKCETAVENASRDYLLLDWALEIPVLKIVLGGGRTTDSVSTFYYVPEDSGDYIQRWNITDPAGNPYYFYSQSPGGVWNHKGTTTFVPYWGRAEDVVDVFTDQTVTARPTSIIVTRAQQ